MTEKRYDAIVIGAGHNGLITAGYLARDGLSVLVLERLDKIGGAATTDEFAPGFYGPMCSYVCYMLHGKVIDDLQMREHGFEIVKPGGKPGLSAWMRIHPFPDGTYLGGPNINSHLDTMEQLRQFSEHDARHFLDWVAFWEQAAGILYPYFLTEPPTLAELVDGVRGTRQEQVLEKMLTWSMIDMVEEYFEDDRVQANFLGIPECDPRAPGSAMSNAYFRQSQFSREQDRGIPRGSMGTITKSIASAIRSFGAEVRTKAPVKEVIVENGEAKGVRLADGEEIYGFIVVSNADPKRTFNTLVKPEDAGEATMKKVSSWKTQAGCVKFLAAMKEPLDLSRYLGNSYDPKSIVNVGICPSVEYFLRSWDDAVAGKPTSAPLMHIQMPSLVDPGLAPKGGVVMSNWVLYYPPQPKEGSWDSYRQIIGEQIVDIITEYVPNFRKSLVDWSVQAPIDIETRVGITDGNIRHGDMIPRQMLDQRFPYRTSIKNFYMCGSGTHPGGEVTGGPGHNCAQAILKDLSRVAV